MREDMRRISGGAEPNKQGNYLKGADLGTLVFCTRWAVDVQGVGPEWIEVVEIDLHLQSPHNRLHGTRIAHISDLHHSRTVSSGYLRRCIERINILDVDLVVLTGDYITYDIRGTYRKKVVAMLGDIESRFGTYACLGNHDYGIRGLLGYRREHLVRRLIQGMEAKGIAVLRNESTVLSINGHPLLLVGLGDLRIGDFHPQKAFADVPTDQVTIALIHNPRGIEHLGEFVSFLLKTYSPALWVSLTRQLVGDSQTIVAVSIQIVILHLLQLCISALGKPSQSWLGLTYP